MSEMKKIYTVTVLSNEKDFEGDPISISFSGLYETGMQDLLELAIGNDYEVKISLEDVEGESDE